MKTSKVLGDIIEKARKVGTTKVGKDGITRIWSKTSSGFDWRRQKGSKKKATGKIEYAGGEMVKPDKPKVSPEIAEVNEKEKNDKFYADKGTLGKKPKNFINNKNKFKNGFGFTFKIGSSKVAFLSYNSGGQEDLKNTQSLNLASVQNLKDNYDIPEQIVSVIQANYVNESKKVSQDDFSKDDLDYVIITNHNVDNVFIKNNVKEKNDKSYVDKIEQQEIRKKDDKAEKSILNAELEKALKVFNL